MQSRDLHVVQLRLERQRFDRWRLFFVAPCGVGYGVSISRSSETIINLECRLTPALACRLIARWPICTSWLGSAVLVRGAGRARWAERMAQNVSVIYQLRGRNTSATFGQRLFGRPLSKSNYVALTGALRGSKIDLMMEASRMHLHVYHPLYHAHRVVYRDRNGILTMKNEWFGLEDHAQRGRGKASEPKVKVKRCKPNRPRGS